MASAVDNLASVAKAEKKEQKIVSVVLPDWLKHTMGATELRGTHPNDRNAPRFTYEVLEHMGHVRVCDVVSGKTMSFPLAQVAVAWA